MGVEQKYYCEHCGRTFGDDELDTYEDASDGYRELVHKACQYNNFNTLAQPATMKSVRWAERSDIERCASLVKHFVKEQGHKATLEGFMHWLGEHENGYTWEEE